MFDGYKYYVLVVLTASFIIGELNHYLLGVVSKDVARDVGYGDKACYGLNGSVDPVCSAITQEQEYYTV